MIKKNILNWTDTSLGTSDSWPWIAFLNWFFLTFYICLILYAFFHPQAKGMFEDQSWAFVLSIFALVFCIYLLALCVAFSIFGIKTARRVRFDGDRFVLNCYYGRSVEFTPDEVMSVEKFHLSGYIKKIMPKAYMPLSKCTENWKLMLKNGTSFFLNGNLSEIESLLDLLNGKS